MLNTNKFIPDYVECVIHVANLVITVWCYLFSFQEKQKEEHQIIIQNYLRTARKEHKMMLERKAVIEARKEYLESLHVERVRLVIFTLVIVYWECCSDNNKNIFVWYGCCVYGAPPTPHPLKKKREKK